MNILVIEGSPHKKGSSNMLADQFIQGAEEAGHNIKVFDAAHTNIHPCLGCDYCGMNGSCVQKDDMQECEKLIKDSDMVVFVTPIYYFGMSAQLKMIIDRFYSFNSSISGKGLKTALITAAWDSKDRTMSYLKEQYLGICDYLEFNNQGMILGTGCGTPSMTNRTGHMKKAYELGYSLK